MAASTSGNSMIIVFRLTVSICFPSTNSFVTLSSAYAHAGAVESRGAFSTNAPPCASIVSRSLFKYSCAQAGVSSGGMRYRPGGAATRASANSCVHLEKSR